MKHCIVIGGGIVGLCSAYYLRQQGHEVTIVDQSNMDEGASYVNAGYLSPSHIIPLSAPGVMKKGLRWMLNPASPLYIKPRLNKDFLNWTWAFNKSCNPRHVQRSAPIIRDISVLSQELYKQIIDEEGFDAHYERKGLMMLCQTEKGMEEELAMANLAKSLNLETKELNKEDISQLEPKVKINAIGGVYYLCDHHSTPSEFMGAMKDLLMRKGVKINKNEKVEGFNFQNNLIESVRTEKQIRKADHFVMATGSWSSDFNKQLGIKILMQAGKGYRINTQRETGISMPAILSEAKAAITPMNGFTRFAGTMEIAGINKTINRIRVEAIARAVTKYYPEIKLNEQEKNNAQCGLRPVTPDGLPYIGNISKFNNLTIAAGHAMMGWSMATATGLLVSQIVDDTKPIMPVEPFSPQRTFGQ